MNKCVPLLLYFTLCAALAGCFCDGGSSAYAHLDRSDSLAGPDADNNGIRGDIDAYIAKQPYAAGPKKRAAVSQFVRAMQQNILVDPKDMLAVREVDRLTAHAQNCIYLRFVQRTGDIYPANIATEILSITTNTKKRLVAYLAVNEALDGKVLSLPTGDTCDE